MRQTALMTMIFAFLGCIAEPALKPVVAMVWMAYMSADLMIGRAM